MDTTRPENGEIASKGERIYQERLKPLLEPNHIGEYVVIDVETGEYELDRDHMAASDRAAAKKPGARLYAMKVGFRAAGRIGRRARPRADGR